MASGNFSGYIISSSAYKLLVEWLEEEQSIADNDTSLKVTVSLVQGSSWSLNVGARTGSVTVDGEKYDFTAPAIRNSGNTSTVIFSKTINISHGDDGKKKCAISAVYNINFTRSSTGKHYDNINASSTFDLTDIPRASSIASVTSSVTANGKTACSVTISRKASVFYHKVTWSLGNKSYSVEGVGTSAKYTIPSHWANNIINSTSAKATVSVETYANADCSGQKIGDTATANFTVTVPSSAVIKIADGWASLSPNQSAAPANISDWDIYVAGYSKIKVVFDSSKEDVSALLGAAVSCRTILVDGIETSSSGTTIVSDVIKTSGEVTVELRIYDTRGRYVSASKSINVCAYTKPVLSGISTFRCNNDGDEDDEGNFLYAKATAGIAPCNGRNTYSLYTQYRKIEGTWSNPTYLTSSTAAIYGNIDESLSYEVRIILMDALGGKATYVTEISSAAVDFNIRDDGNGAALGGYAEDPDTFKIPWKNFKFGDIVLNSDALSAFLSSLSTATSIADIADAAAEFYNKL